MDKKEELLEEEEASILTLVNEDGIEEKFEYIATVTYGGDEYLILLPVEDDSEVEILKIVPEDDENESYVSLDDDDLLNAVYDVFKAEYKDVFDFED